MAPAKKKQSASPPPAERGQAPAKKRQSVPPPPAKVCVRLDGKPTRAQRSLANKQLQRTINETIFGATTKSKIVHINTDVKRPTKYTPELGVRICTMFAEDARMTLARMQADHTLPAISTFYDWISKHDTLARAYAHARKIQADMQAEELAAIAEAPLPLVTTVERTGGKDGGSKEVRTTDNVARSALYITTRQWLLARQQPKQYGAQAIGDEDGSDPLRELLAQFRAQSAQMESDGNT